MPINIKKGEREEEFISRCIGEEIGAGKAEETAAAICYSYWRQQENLTKVKELKAAIKEIKNYG